MLVGLGREQGKIGDHADAHEEAGIEQVRPEIKMQRNSDVAHLMMVTVEQDVWKRRRKQQREVGRDVGDTVGTEETEPPLGAVGFLRGRLF